MGQFTTALIGTLLIGSAGWAKGLAPATPKMLELGKTLYATNCLACHGETGNGDGPAGKMMKPKPREFATAEFKNGATPEGIFKSISEGLPGTAMAPFAKKLTDEERTSLAHYVLKLRNGK